MRLKTIPLTLFLLFLSVFSCGKLNPEKISGIVSDDSTQSSVFNAEVGLYDYHDYSTSNLVLLKSSNSGTDGKFAISYTLKKRKSYALIIQKPGFQNYFYSFKVDDKISGLEVKLKK